MHGPGFGKEGFGRFLLLQFCGCALRTTNETKQSSRVWRGKPPSLFSPQRGFRFKSEGPPRMTKPFRRFEILIPLRFNNDQSVPEEQMSETLLELRHRFGAVSCETQTIHGMWQHEGETHHDELMRVFIDVADLPENLEFFQKLKERLKTQYRQTDIWLTSYPVEVI